MRNDDLGDEVGGDVGSDMGGDMGEERHEDMHGGDDEFDAFLNGKDALSRRLQALPQPSSGAALDAAILAQVRSSLQRGSRPALSNELTTHIANDVANDFANDAANDAAPATPRLQPGFGTRWRIPVGIAATLLAGVFAHQVFDAGAGKEAALILSESAGSAPVPVAAKTTATVPADTVPREEIAAAAPPPPSSPALPAAPSKPDAPVAARARAPGLAPSTAPTAAPAQPGVPEPLPQEPAAGRATSRDADRTPAAAAAAPAPAPPPAPAPAPALQFNYGPVANAPLQRSMANRALSPDAGPGARVEIAGASIKKAPDLKRAEEWLGVIETMLQAGLKTDAREEWLRFRKAYPDYQVPEELKASIDAVL